jgi:hypothetical protein
MSSLKAFLNPIRIEDKEVIVSNRFVEDKKVVPFKIRAITQEENSVLIRKFTKRDKKNVETFDRPGYVAALTASAVVFPDLKNAELQKAYGVLGESELLQKMLYTGEYAELSLSVQEHSGLENDINDKTDEAKNG